MAGGEVDIIMCVLREQDGVGTRLKETSSGDREYLQCSDLALRTANATGEGRIATLRDLVCKGVIIRTERVHPDDSSEYISSWHL